MENKKSYLSFPQFYTNIIRHKNHILASYFDKSGRKRREKILYNPTLYCSFPSQDTNKETKFSDIYGNKVFPINPGNMFECHNFIKEYENISNINIFGMTNYIYPFIYEEFKDNLSPDINLLSIANIDIEVASDQGFPNINQAIKPITAITVKKKPENSYHVFGCGEFDVSKIKDDYKDNEIIYYKSNSETELLRNFISFWKRADIDVITGWNVHWFDIPYLVHRISNVLGAELSNRLSPWNIVEKREVFINNNYQTTYDIAGISVLDYLDLYKKFSFKNQESYRLDYIANQELGTGKLSYEEYDGLYSLYKHDYQKFIEYNIKDVDLVDRLETKIGMMRLVFEFAYNAKVNFSDTLTSVNLWDVIIHNYLMDNNQVIPLKIKNNKENQIVGGFVKEPNVGAYKWIVSFDLTSLYPHLIMNYNISPEMLNQSISFPSHFDIDSVIRNNGISIEEKQFLKNNNVSLCASSLLFNRNKQGIFPAIMEKTFKDRKTYKDTLFENEQKLKNCNEVEKSSILNNISTYNNLQLAKKIQLNSLYGAMSNAGFRWFDDRLAQSITLSGQLAIKWICYKINLFFNDILKTKDIDYIIASDTDSCLINVNPLVEMLKFDENDKEKIIKFIDEFSNNVLGEYIDEQYKHLAEEMNAFEHKMKMKRETIADRGIFVAKKRYVLNVWSNEVVFYNEPKIKMTGIEAIRSSTPSLCRDAIKKAIHLMLNSNEQEFRHFIKTFREEFYHSDFENIAFSRTCNNLEKYSDNNTIYRSATPIHVRGALVYNNFLQKKNIDKYKPIMEGEKIKFCYLKLPNPTFENVISTQSSLPKILDLDKYIDYQLQFEKSFEEPINNIIHHLKWSINHNITLEDILNGF